LSDRSILLSVSSNCSDALDGRVFASIPLEREALECLKERARCYHKAKEVYPDLYETYEFHSLPQWYETGKGQEYDDQADRDKLERFSYDAELDEGESYDGSPLAALDNLETEEIQWLLIPAEELPGEGNLRTECDQLVMALSGGGSTRIELRWICYVKHTDVELRTAAITSDDIDRWLSELAGEEGHQPH
jgi:hypothetical protein